MDPPSDNFPSCLCFHVVPRNKIQIVVPVFVMLYMTLGHLHRQYINYLGWDMDFTSAQMVLTQKLYMMAYNLHDGDALANGKENRAAKKCEKYALKEVPGIFEYLGYTFCFANILAGPSFEFTVYRNACDGTLLYTPEGKPRGPIPSNILPSLMPFLKSLVNLIVFVVLGGMFPLLDTVDPQKNTPVVSHLNSSRSHGFTGMPTCGLASLLFGKSTTSLGRLPKVPIIFGMLVLKVLMTRGNPRDGISPVTSMCLGLRLPPICRRSVKNGTRRLRSGLPVTCTSGQVETLWLCMD